MEQNKFCFCKIMLVVTVIKYTICLQSSAQDLKIGAKLKQKEFIFVKKKMVWIDNKNFKWHSWSAFLSVSV